ncbi:uncharacterized protein LOC123527064 [Mercenaria mercenaria]|uniref:uncharacterized protein LOC123527064 n=1 Tax=Mercenaria mercenaria TaxID=6596 RepID=UPI00234EF3C0|nr:uncharacterized protein LOC123527064 [Mercenaria mercenaria]
MAYTCAVNNCSQGSYWLNKWKSQLCETCGCLRKDRRCKCEPPFRLFPFPTKIRKPELRQKWKQLVGRKDGSKLWSPSKDSRVCSKHFIEGEPTLKNPVPTENLGYTEACKRVKRMALFEATSVKPCRKRIKLAEESTKRNQKRLDFEAVSMNSDMESARIETESTDPEVETLPKSQTTVPVIFTLLAMFIGLFNYIYEQSNKIAKLQAEIEILKHENKKFRKNFTDKILKTNDDVNFYTGLGSRSLFDKLHSVISPLVNRRWIGVVSVVKKVRNFRPKTRLGPARKLTSKSEFMMMLMKLRLGLLNKDLAKRFNISESLCSKVFFAWLRASFSVLRSLVYIPDEEALIGSKPERFRDLPDLHSIIDCTELFIETPKDLFLQSQSWSDYKHHNTLKILVACSPNSSIIYVSPAYLGRVSDKALTLDCGYLDKIPSNCMIMADKGFNLSDECADRCITLYVPPGKRGHSQMTSAAVGKTKRIANRRILIEQVIRRLKTFRILANEIQISTCGHIDEIIGVCAALSNFKPPIYKS